MAVDAQRSKKSSKGPFSIERFPPQKRGTRNKPGRNPKAYPIVQAMVQDSAYYQITPNESHSCPSP